MNSQITFETHPDRYRYWRLAIDSQVAVATLDVPEDEPFRPGYVLKLNSYDLGVDIELADIIERLRFEHPEVGCLVVTSGNERVFCSGANIPMLGSSTHAFKVNFCKFTNETRLYLEEASRESGLHTICAVNGACAGGGYELAMACDEILLVGDGSSTVSLPEVPLLAVLPGTGGLTRLTDKRRVRRDRADFFATLAEGIKGNRAKEWGLVDDVLKKSSFREEVATWARDAAAATKMRDGIELEPLSPKIEEEEWRYRHLVVKLNRAGRSAEFSIAAPSEPPPATAEELAAAGSAYPMLRLFRELDDAILRLRFLEPEIGLWLLRATGDGAAVVAHDEALCRLRDAGDWLAREILLKARRTLKRLELSARSIFSFVDAESAFSGSLFEAALAGDRIYMLDDEGVSVRLSPANFGPLPMSNGLTRLATRFWGCDAQCAAVSKEAGEEAVPPFPALSTGEADRLGLVTLAPDDIDWEDEVRIACEERASLSPDALTGMEASLRYPGPETMETKIFARLTAWQNWIFQRPNAVGERGALTLYGRPERPKFDYRRT